ncbi:hypothetical protein HPB49_003055 [Dermacentor silvarum]|uniref:Uncharacterized protein n=1 Tax=Dermacentor silvarum TaxID=543639 RepID=A0ACB8DTF1_DERSI|nr:hypothetical protein HPB49_003055 [Dermacentor silvarum]
MAKVISEDSTQYSGPPMQDGKWANGKTTDYLKMYQKTAPAVADGDAKTRVETITVGEDLIQISGRNDTIVNISTCVLRSFFFCTTADRFNLANQDLSSMLTGSAAFKTLGTNGQAAGKRPLKGFANFPEFETSADDQQVLPSSTMSVAAGPPCSTHRGLKMYTREFLLQCSQSSLATQVPPDFPVLDPEVANAMVKEVHHKVND